jgi:hypothetical protein
MKFTPVHCCIIWRDVPRMVRRKLDDGFLSPPLKQLALIKVSSIFVVKVALKIAYPRRKVSRLWYDTHFIFVVGNNLGKLLLDILRILRLTSNSR